MKIRLVSPFILLCSLLVTEVSSTWAQEYQAVYDLQLVDVERPADAKNRYGEQTVAAISDSGIQRWLFEDSLVQILWLPTKFSFNFVLKNKTSHTIKIVWDEAAYVDESGEGHQVTHEGVKYTDAHGSHPPTIVVRNGKISDLVASADKVRYFVDDWQLWPMFDIYFEDDIERLKAESGRHKGANLQVLLPLEIEGVLNEYIFSFVVKDVEVGRRRSSMK